MMRRFGRWLEWRRPIPRWVVLVMIGLAILNVLAHITLLGG
jgi:hypothetical protein